MVGGNNCRIVAAAMTDDEDEMEVVKTTRNMVSWGYNVLEEHMALVYHVKDGRNFAVGNSMVSKKDTHKAVTESSNMLP